jgi:Tfp pilus tip-associated adhesin PilY1
MTDYVVKVKVCAPAMPEKSSKKYPSGVYKPVGLLQRYGEAGSMLFGLLSGSYEKNTSGGVLRKPIGVITDEIDPNTGQLTSVNGIIRTIDNFRIDGFTYNTHAYEDRCGWITDGPIADGECWMWGNPIAEMMYEGLRYFAGEAAATGDFDYGALTSARDDILGLPRAAWDDPFETNDFCAKAFMLVLSDINPTYDSDQLPGVDSQFGSTFTGTLYSADSPAAAFGAESFADEISTEEGGLGTHYIGQLNADFDGSCNPKDLSGSGFGDVRGLCPEEPTKEGSYYAAGAAYFGRTHDMNDAQGEQNVLTYVVGLASPLPRIEIPVGGSTVTLVPFGKTVGTRNNPGRLWSFQPTNTIVDFYIESLRPTSGTFRINYEDVEQGADHDMDAICIYEYQVVDDSGDAVTNPADGTQVRLTLISEYAAGSYIQHMGYVISGTTADGVYLEVRDEDTDESQDVDYPYDTPPGVAPGESGSLWDDDRPLPLVATRIFRAGETPAATLLESPLWYAAKWGGFTDLDGDRKPNLQSEWDEDGNGVPDTYFYVVNPLKLDQQLNRSFADILARGVSHVAPVVSVDEANRTQSGDRLYMAFFKPMEENYWQGNLKKYGLSLLTRSECGRAEPEWSLVDKNGAVAGECDGRFKGTSISYWSETADGGYVDRGGVGAVLKASMPGSDPVAVPSSGPYYEFRRIYTYKDGHMIPFIHDNISKDDLAVADDVIRCRIINWIYGYTFDTSADSTPVAKREWVLGDMIHSEPRIIEYEDLSGTGVAYRYVAVGANDGMVHFFTDAAATIAGTSYGAGEEIFAFVPGDLLPKLQNIGDPTRHTVLVDGAMALHRSESKHSSGYYHKTLVFGERRGGRSYWALDVTQPDPTTWTVKWHIQGGPADLGGTVGFEELAYTWSRPHFAKLKTDDSAVVKEVVIFGGGYDPLEDAFPESFEDLNENGIWDDLNGNGKYDSGDEVFAATVGGTEHYDYYNPGKDNMGRGLFVVDLSDGNILFRVSYRDESVDVTTGIDQKYGAMTYCFPADISVIPFSPYEIVMYAADIYGQIWKITYDYFRDRNRPYDDPNSTRWTVKRIFTANPGSDLATGDPGTFRAATQALNSADAGRKMFYSPDVSYFGNKWTTKPVLYFGTGDRAHPRYAMISNRIYLVTDEDTLADETDLLNVSCNELDEGADADGDGSVNSEDDVIRGELYEILESGGEDCRGLYRILEEQGDCTDDRVDHTGESVLSQPTVFFKNVYFTSYRPTFDDPCNPAGNAFIYALDYSDYTAVFNFDESNDLSGPVRTISDTYRYLTGSSIPSGVKVITRQGQAAGVLSAGGAVAGAGQGGSTSIPGPPGGIEPLLWWVD